MAKKQKKAKKTQKTSKPAAKSAHVQTNTFGLQPLGERVLIKPEAAETTTPSGIIIPETAKQEKSTIGRVIAVGEGKWDDGVLIPIPVQVGDKVFYNPGWENEIEYKGEKYFIVSAYDIKAIFA